MFICELLLVDPVDPKYAALPEDEKRSAYWIVRKLVGVRTGLPLSSPVIMPFHD